MVTTLSFTTWDELADKTQDVPKLEIDLTPDGQLIACVSDEEVGHIEVQINIQ